jgi:hypothetical protein
VDIVAVVVEVVGVVDEVTGLIVGVVVGDDNVVVDVVGVVDEVTGLIVGVVVGDDNVDVVGETKDVDDNGIDDIGCDVSVLVGLIPLSVEVTIGVVVATGVIKEVKGAKIDGVATTGVTGAGAIAPPPPPPPPPIGAPIVPSSSSSPSSACCC